MSYRLSIPRRVTKRMERFPAEAQDRVDAAILDLAYNPRPPGCRKLQGRESWRIRVGDHRVIYEIDDEAVVTILQAGRRRDVYR